MKVFFHSLKQALDFFHLKLKLFKINLLGCIGHVANVQWSHVAGRKKALGSTNLEAGAACD